MTDDLISQIQSFTLSARAALETEASQQLEGIYGWLPDGTFSSAKGYPALGTIDEARETRQRLEQFVEDEKAAGLDAKSARRKIIHETAFTWLNRLAAFRLMEERRLLKQTILRLSLSNGFIFWLTDERSPQGQQAYALHQKGPLPLNAMGEGPSDVAYRHFLLWQCGELARDVSVLFDAGALASRLCPRPSVLKQVVTEMNAEALSEAWRTGNEETIGWIYQAFNAEELQAAFAAARESKKKFDSADIPAVTQLFTIRWVVRFLVENTLGRLWVEMHPDSILKDELGYLVPVQKSNRSLKPAREITFLDPCCGSMHFGLVAFDLFSKMYCEEIANVGKPGWPAKPSVVSENEIASSIVEHNLFGIDIDLRAVQLSALSLLLRARSKTNQCAFTDQNFACANVEQLTGGRLDELITATQFSNRAEERILRALATRIAESPNLGSLLRLESDLSTLVDAERKKMLTSSQPELVFSGLTDDLFASTRDLNAFFDQLTESLSKRLDAYARVKGAGSGHVAHEASKGVRYLRLVQRRYDVIATNPPYLSARKMNKHLAVLLEKDYKAGKQDLYAAFILRNQELLAPQGLLGMLTMHSFLFTGSYEDLRKNLREEVALEVMAHYGGGLFAVGNPGTLQTTAFVLRKEIDSKARETNNGVYFRLVRERDADTKRVSFEEALAALRINQSHPRCFIYRQSDFSAISGHPWVYWFSPKIRELFARYPVLRDAAPPRVGLQTGENLRFLRKWWEVGLQRISIDCTDCEVSKSTGKTWFPYMKGGTPIPWFGNQEHIVKWKNNGEELYAFRPASVIRNPTFYFRKGVTWSDVSSKGFAGRLSPGGFVHDVKGMTCYPSEASLWTILGIFNSCIAEFILSGLNPTISYQVGDIERLPLASSVNAKIDLLVQEAVELAKKNSEEIETAYQFINPPVALNVITAREQHLAGLETKIDGEVSLLYKLNDDDLAFIRQELEGAPSTESEAGVTELEEKNNDSTDDEEDGASDWNGQKLAQAWISYAFGTVLGRFEIGVASGLGRGDFPAKAVAEIHKLVDPDGIIASDENHPDDIVRRVLNILLLMLSREAAYRTIRFATAGDGDPEHLLRKWIDRQFWKYHLQLYRKKPIFWPLQSPGKKFTVWLFQEQLNKDTLFRVKDQFVQVKINWLNGRIRDLKPKVLSIDTRERRAAEKEISQLSDILDDVQDFAERLKRITGRGYTPHIDDGVLLNAAPLWELLPAWKETEKTWKELEAGKYEWAHQAMEYWPERVKEACETNKSLAIAHGLA